MGRPIIGLTTYREHARWGVWDADVDIQSTLYTDAVAASGGAVVLVPPAETGVVDVLRALDGLIVSGGADVDPAAYDAEAHPEAGRFAVTATTPSLRWSSRCGRGVPVLGICRGMQVLNVALGGDLIQHLPEIAGVLPQRRGAGVFSTRAVTLDADSWIGRTLGAGVPTACHHHQAVVGCAGPAHRRSRRRRHAGGNRGGPTARRCSACSGTPSNSKTAGCSKRSSAWPRAVVASRDAVRD